MLRLSCRFLVVFSQAYPELEQFAKNNFLPQHPLRHSPLWLEEKDLEWNEKLFRSFGRRSPLQIDAKAHDPFMSPYSPLYQKRKIKKKTNPFISNHPHHYRKSNEEAVDRKEEEGAEEEEPSLYHQLFHDSNTFHADDPLVPSSSTPPEDADLRRRATNNDARGRGCGGAAAGGSLPAGTGRSYSYSEGVLLNNRHPKRWERRESESDGMEESRSAPTFIPICTMPTMQPFYVFNAEEVELSDGGIGPCTTRLLTHVLELQRRSKLGEGVKWDLEILTKWREAEKEGLAVGGRTWKKSMPLGESEDEEEEESLINVQACAQTEDERQRDGWKRREDRGQDSTGEGWRSSRGAPEGFSSLPPPSFLASFSSSSFYSSSPWEGVSYCFPQDTSDMMLNASNGFPFCPTATEELKKVKALFGFTSNWWATALQWKDLGCTVLNGYKGGGGGRKRRRRNGGKGGDNWDGHRVVFPRLNKLVHISLIKDALYVLSCSYIDNKTRILRCITPSEFQLFNEYQSLRFLDEEKGLKREEEVEVEQQQQQQRCLPILANLDSTTSTSFLPTSQSETFLQGLTFFQCLNIAVMRDMRKRYEKLISHRLVIRQGEDPFLFPLPEEVKVPPFISRTSPTNPTLIFSAKNTARAVANEKEAPQKEEEAEEKEEDKESSEPPPPLPPPPPQDEVEPSSSPQSVPSSLSSSPVTVVPPPPRALVVYPREEIEVFFPLYISAYLIRQLGLRVHEDWRRKSVLPAISSSFSKPPSLLPVAIEVLKGTTTCPPLSSASYLLPSSVSSPTSFYSSTSPRCLGEGGHAEAGAGATGGDKPSSVSTSSSCPFKEEGGRASITAPRVVLRYFFHISDVHLDSSSSSSSSSSTFFTTENTAAETEKPENGGEARFPLPPGVWPRLFECTDPRIPHNGMTGERLPFVELEVAALSKHRPHLVRLWEKYLGNKISPCHTPSPTPSSTASSRKGDTTPALHTGMNCSTATTTPVLQIMNPFGDAHGLYPMSSSSPPLSSSSPPPPGETGEGKQEEEEEPQEQEDKDRGTATLQKEDLRIQPEEEGRRRGKGGRGGGGGRRKKKGNKKEEKKKNIPSEIFSSVSSPAVRSTMKESLSILSHSSACPGGFSSCSSSSSSSTVIASNNTRAMRRRSSTPVLVHSSYHNSSLSLSPPPPPPPPLGKSPTPSTSPSSSSIFFPLSQRSIWLESIDILELGGTVNPNASPVEVQENSEANLKRWKEIQEEEWKQKAARMGSKQLEQKQEQQQPPHVNGQASASSSFSSSSSLSSSLPDGPLHGREELFSATNTTSCTNNHRHSRTARTTTSRTDTFSFPSPRANNIPCEEYQSNGGGGGDGGADQIFSEEKREEVHGLLHISCLWDTFDFLSKP